MSVDFSTPEEVGRAMGYVRVRPTGHVVPTDVRLAAERTREDLGVAGHNYPDIRKLLSFVESLYQKETRHEN